MKGMSTPRLCVTCGTWHRRHGDECFGCRKLKQNKLRESLCPICVTTFIKTIRPFCSYECSQWLRVARQSVASAMNSAINNGLIPPLKGLLCVDCGKDAEHYDHREYLKPLVVEPVCRSCNYRRAQATDLNAFMAKYFGIAQSKVKFRVKRKQFPPTQKRSKFIDLVCRKTNTSISCQLLEKYPTDTSIAKAFGVSRQAVSLWIKRDRLPDNYQQILNGCAS